MSKTIHKLEREEWSEYPYETEKVICDRLDRYSDPKCSTSWLNVTCKICLRYKPKITPDQARQESEK